jgi:hypothetical protein
MKKLELFCLKGQCHEIFDLRFFSWISFPPEYPIRAVSNFVDNLRRYSQLKVYHRWRWQRWQMEKTSRRKGLNILFGHLWVVECRYTLKVLINEKRGGLTVILFDRSSFHLFTLKFSNKSVQSSSCERSKTAQWTPFLSLEINNCFPIQTSLLVLSRHSKYRYELLCYLKRFIMKFRFIPSSQISGRMFQWSVWCEKCVAARLCRYL